MSGHERDQESPFQRAERENISIIEAIRRLRWEGLEQVKERGEAMRMSAITAHVLDTRFHVLAEAEASSDDPDQLGAALSAYADGVAQAPKPVLLRHLAGLMWAVIKRRD